MTIDPDVEQTTRDLLGHVIRGEFAETADAIEATGAERFPHCLSLSLRVAGYIAIDACSWQWPTEADLLEIVSRTTAASEDLSEADSYAYLARCALGFEVLADVFRDQTKVATIPLLATAALLITYNPPGRTWDEYLTIIERSLDLVAPLPEATVPALFLQARRRRALKDADPGRPGPQ
jgi:hypothetical protein